MPNGIDLILADHREVEILFTQFAAEPTGANVGRIVDALHAHDDAEHAALYPLVGHVLGDTALVQRLAAAHSRVKKQIDLMTSLEGSPLIEAVSQLRNLVTEHVKDEETEVLPRLAEAATPQQIDGLGARILQAKQRGG